MGSIIVKRMALRFALALILLAIITSLFWTSSRYPALDDKAMMGGSIQLEDPLSFEAHWPVDAELPVWKKVFLTTLNWLHTNRQGMFFGVLMGAVFLTLMRYLQRISFKNAFLNSAAGLLLGAPLGVCVNCAAPIAKGLYAGGARAETMLAAMIASPTLNIVVLTMLFSILPFYMAVTKVVLCLMVILLAVPIICRFLPERQRQLPMDERRACEIPAFEDNRIEPPWVALKGFAQDISADLWYIIRLTVPLMVLAGFLGALVATLIPIELLNDVKFGLIGLLIIAVIGTFLPVPIAFDVVICGALLAGGLAVGSVMTLLFTLGIFSIYSFFIVGQSVSIRAASLMALVVIFVGAGAGLGVDKWHGNKTQQALELLTATSSQTDSVSGTTPVLNSLENSPNTPNNLAADPAAYKIELTRKPFNPRSPAADTPFTRLEAQTIGIDKPIEFSFKDMWPPYWEGRSISAGDFDKDGDNDLLLASTEKGLYFYANDGRGKFTALPMPIGDLKNWPIFNAALVDINNDGWLDIFIATYKKGNYVLWNEAGKFDAARLTPVKNRDDAMLSLALSFADIDRDGDLDAAIGNWAAGWYRRIPGLESQNRIIFNDDGNLSGRKFQELSGLPGETLSILLTDIDSDGDADLLVGNDFEMPDIYYHGDGQGDFTRIRRQDNIIPHTTNTTMGIKAHDLNNDIIPEIYSVQISGRSSGVSERLKMQPIENYCDDIVEADQKAICQKNMDIKSWYKSGNNFDPSYAHKCLELEPAYQAECKAMLVKDLAIQGEDPSICGLINANQSEIRSYCDIHFKAGRPLTQKDVQDNYPQIKRSNVLLMRQAGGAYTDEAVERGLEVGGWSWDTKIADFDNDEWADIYIVNGTWVPNEFTPSNMYFSNDGTGGFSEQAEDYGLDDYLMTAAATKLDIDHDGDLDIITIPVNGPTQTFLNNTQTGNAINFELRDRLGNHFGIGARIVIHYGDNGQRQQLREIQSGGGFQSFDAPQAHFGLGQYRAVSKVSIYWADGSVSEITDPISAGATYIISRDMSEE